MHHFTAASDVTDLPALLAKAARCKADPLQWSTLGRGKTLGLIFFNPSLRTRLSTQKAAHNLGLQCIVMNIGTEGWQLEFEDGAVMNAGTAEHVKDAAAVMGRYCDIIGVRSFPGLKDREEDYQERVLEAFKKYAGVPILSLESATRHPLQSLADLLTIEEYKQVERPKIVLSWAPHPRALPQAVANSFAEWIRASEYDLVITHPEGYDLAAPFFAGHTVTYDQNEALKDADFVYVKNWSSYRQYGQILSQDPSWMITEEKMALTNQGKFMHCLPVRRNVIVADGVIDSADSIVLDQAENRTYAAQAVLATLLGK
ncbi:MAG: N-acetylornithine carbamoyltransferase [Bacteroidia bacterium]|nr:N-acetylornithine carbamoyltransferase [Bacteroidia bacterium]